VNALGHPSSVLVLGGGSDIAGALVRRFADAGAKRVVLAGRDSDAMALRGAQIASAASVEVVAFDAADTAQHAAVLDEVFQGGDIDCVVLAFGVLGDQELAERDPEHAVEVAKVNYVGAVSAGLHVARRFRSQGHGVLVVLSSVAGERARRSNFVYGSTKAGLDAFAQGLGDALSGTGSRVLVVRPGFVRSKMTAGMDPVPFSTTPEQVAEAITRSLQRHSDVVWAPAILRLVMMVLRHLPRVVFRKLPI
jgi:decaprenylphospho-beta-D-erythro-pentofuranosid-2-ulose 2-reductase